MLIAFCTAYAIALDFSHREEHGMWLFAIWPVR